MCFLLITGRSWLQCGSAEQHSLFKVLWLLHWWVHVWTFTVVFGGERCDCSFIFADHQVAFGQLTAGRVAYAAPTQHNTGTMQSVNELRQQQSVFNCRQTNCQESFYEPPRCQRRVYFRTLDALSEFRLIHRLQQRKSVSPEFSHQAVQIYVFS